VDEGEGDEAGGDAAGVEDDVKSHF
jgi:hypothetical protein